MEVLDTVRNVEIRNNRIEHWTENNWWSTVLQKALEILRWMWYCFVCLFLCLVFRRWIWYLNCKIHMLKRKVAIMQLDANCQSIRRRTGFSSNGRLLSRRLHQHCLERCSFYNHSHELRPNAHTPSHYNCWWVKRECVEFKKEKKNPNRFITRWF